MNKLLVIALLAATAFSIIQSVPVTKKQKIEQLFGLMNDKKILSKAWEPMFASVSITDEQVKKSALDRYVDTIKKDFITVYDKYFTDLEIDEMLKYNSSATGKKFNSIALDLNGELQKAYSSMMGIIQEVMPKPEAPAVNAKSAQVVHFDELSKGKKDAEVRDLFNKELKHNGLTVVKFSAGWCGPCKNYAPVFSEVAEQLKEVKVNGKTIAIKYIATDIDATKIIAQDYSVVSIPATLFYKDGKKIDSQAGYMSNSALSNKIKQLAK